MCLDQITQTENLPESIECYKVFYKGPDVDNYRPLYYYGRHGQLSEKELEVGKEYTTPSTFLIGGGYMSGFHAIATLYEARNYARGQRHEYPMEYLRIVKVRLSEITIKGTQFTNDGNIVDTYVGRRIALIEEVWSGRDV